MKYFLAFIIIISVGSCNSKKGEKPEINENNWSKRKIALDASDSLEYGKTYLSVYSQIYSYTQYEKFNLTGMISLRNISDKDTVYIQRADYYNTEGTKIRTYFDYPIYLLPMETLEIIISQKDKEGGTGSNFLFEWKTPLNCPAPLFEGIMNSMEGTQGLSFTTTGQRIE